jgi:hypothetical protein
MPNVHTDHLFINQGGIAKLTAAGASVAGKRC